MKQTRLRDIRLSKGLRQLDVARRARITRVFYTQIENGYRLPSMQKASQLANALGISIEELYDALEVTYRHARDKETGREQQSAS
ncbi:MAG: helix-turn-helix transcriptional regulator [Firmicutes bacterium]|nr:helix-turn-helix transcriptional regulator [Bacillota bacterium]